MKPITDPLEIFRVELWLVELKSMFECEAMIATPDVAPVYAARAKEIEDYLKKRDENNEL